MISKLDSIYNEHFRCPMHNLRVSGPTTTSSDPVCICTIRIQNGISDAASCVN